MQKLKYLIKRIINMNFDNFFKTINEISEKHKINKIKLFFDIIGCGIKYQAGYSDYKLYEMYKLNKKQRETIVTRGYNNAIIKKYNDKRFIKYFSSKALFNQKFSKFLKRDYLILDETKLLEFQNFITLHPTIIVKPDSLSCGKGIEKITVNKKNYTQVFNELLLSNRIIVEEVASQCPELAKLHPASVNTLRIVTLGGKVIVAFIRIGNNSNVVDNFNHGGMVAPINIETGIVDYPAIDKDGNIYDKHPLTHEDILWLQIPKWPRVKRFVEKACKVIPEVKYVAWDICLSKEGPIIIEGNDFPGHDLYQLPPHRQDNIGLVPIFEKRMKEMENEK